MAIKERLMDDLKLAMKQKDVVKKSTITMLRAAIKQVEIDTREALNDDQIIDIIARQVKQKKAAIEEFTKGGREDLVTEAKTEIDVLSTYLPEQLSEEEILEIIKKAIEKLSATSIKDMGKVMSVIRPDLTGRSDNKFVADCVKKMLS